MSNITGTVDNGDLAHVVAPFYTGRAGVRARPGGGEFAYAGPVELLRGPVRATVGGRTVQVTALRRSSTSDAMMVAAFRYAAEG